MLLSKLRNRELQDRGDCNRYNAHNYNKKLVYLESVLKVSSYSEYLCTCNQTNNCVPVQSSILTSACIISVQLRGVMCVTYGVISLGK